MLCYIVHVLTCHGTCLSQIHVFGFDVIFVFLVGFCLMLGPFLCVLHCSVVVWCRCSPLIFNAFPSVLVCYPDFVFCPWICEFEQRYTTVAFIYI